MRVGIIGGTGWIGGALGRALIDTGRVLPADLVILTRSGQPGDFQGHPVTWAHGLDDLIARSDVIVVSVRPQDWPGLGLRASGLTAQGLTAPGKPVISVMAGVPLRALPPRTIRALPNAAAELRQSYTPWFASPDCTADDCAMAQHILSAIGTCDVVDSEDHINLMTATSGAGPAYSALMARAVIGFLVQQGVRPQIAQRAAEAMVCGAAPLMAGKMADVDALVQVFIDYKGTTAAGLQTAMDQGFETALTTGLAAATRRAKTMADEA